MGRTKECLPFIISLVKGFPFWSTSSNVPPTLGRPTPLAASAILLRCMRSFSYSKYHTNKPQVPTNKIPAFHEKGYAHLSATYSFFAHRIPANPAKSYPIAISALGLLDRLVLGPALGNRLSRRNGCSEGRPELFRLEGAAGEAALALPCRDGREDAPKGSGSRDRVGHDELALRREFSEAHAKAVSLLTYIFRLSQALQNYEARAFAGTLPKPKVGWRRICCMRCLVIQIRRVFIQ